MHVPAARVARPAFLTRVLLAACTAGALLAMSGCDSGTATGLSTSCTNSGYTSGTPSGACDVTVASLHTDTGTAYPLLVDVKGMSRSGVNLTLDGTVTTGRVTVSWTTPDGQTVSGDMAPGTALHLTGRAEKFGGASQLSLQLKPLDGSDGKMTAAGVKLHLAYS